MQGDGSRDNAKVRCPSLLSFIHLTCVTCLGQPRPAGQAGAWAPVPLGTAGPRYFLSAVAWGSWAWGCAALLQWPRGVGAVGTPSAREDNLRPAGSGVEHDVSQRLVSSGLKSPTGVGPRTGCPREKPAGRVASPHLLLLPAAGGVSVRRGGSALALREVADKAPLGQLNHRAWPPRGVEGLRGSGLRHSCRGRTQPPLQARGRVPPGWPAARGCSESCSWLPAARMDLHTAPRTTTGRPRSPAAFLELDQAQERPVNRCVSLSKTSPTRRRQEGGLG